MGYQNDQFFNIGQSGESAGAPYSERTLNRTRKNYYHEDASNPRFIYPDRTVRTWEYSDVFDRGERVVGKKHFMDETLLKRGYVRSVARTADDKTSKCQFQFNPQNITQSVSMSEGTLNFFSQDPAALGTPLAGNTNITLTLMFDRTMEINNPVNAIVGAGGEVMNSDSAGNPSVGGNGSPNNPWETGSPSQVGVLRDVAALYKVIGQGINTDDLAGRLSEVKEGIKADAISVADGGNYDTEDYREAINNVEELMRINVGNYGLILQRPVRFVFSSLYMVEGYVMNSTVTFGKFNTNFVPIQAAVQLTVNAQHIGFAKKDTFVTYNIARAIEAQAEEQAAETAAQREEVRSSYDPAKQELTNWELSVANPIGGDVLTPGDWGDGAAATIAVVSATQSGSLQGAVKDLFSGGGGASLKVQWSFKLFVGMADRNPTSGQERSSPIFAYTSPPVTYSSASELGDYVDVSSTPRSIREMTEAITLDHGGNMRARWTVLVELRHDGLKFSGTGELTENLFGTSDFSTHRLVASIPVSWTDTGESVSGIPVVDSSSEEPAGATSTVGGRTVGGRIGGVTI